MKSSARPQCFATSRVPGLDEDLPAREQHLTGPQGCLQRFDVDLPGGRLHESHRLAEVAPTLGDPGMLDRDLEDQATQPQPLGALPGRRGRIVRLRQAARGQARVGATHLCPGLGRAGSSRAGRAPAPGPATRAPPRRPPRRGRRSPGRGRRRWPGSRRRSPGPDRSTCAGSSWARAWSPARRYVSPNMPRATADALTVAQLLAQRETLADQAPGPAEFPLLEQDRTEVALDHRLPVLVPGGDEDRQALLEPGPRLPVPALVEQHGAQLDQHGALALEVVVRPVGGACLLEQGDGPGELALVVGHDRQVPQALADHPGLLGRARLGQRLLQDVPGLRMGALPREATAPPQQRVGLQVGHPRLSGQVRRLTAPGPPAPRTHCGGSASWPTAAAAGRGAGRPAAAPACPARRGPDADGRGHPSGRRHPHAPAGRRSAGRARRRASPRPPGRAAWSPRPVRGPTTPAPPPAGTSARRPTRHRCCRDVPRSGLRTRRSADCAPPSARASAPPARDRSGAARAARCHRSRRAAPRA